MGLGGVLVHRQLLGQVDVARDAHAQKPQHVLLARRQHWPLLHHASSVSIGCSLSWGTLNAGRPLTRAPRYSPCLASAPVSQPCRYRTGGTPHTSTNTSSSASQ